MDRSQTPRPGSRVPKAVVLLVLLAVAQVACSLVDSVFGGDVSITEMVPGGSIQRGGVDCWLTFEFEQLPEGADPMDVRVRFESIALVRPAEFDWAYISTNDVVPAGTKFGSGYRDLKASKPDSPPPLGTPIKVKFPLPAKKKIEDAPDKLWLEVTVYWGGKQQDADKRLLEHAYSRTRSSFF